MPQGSTEHPFLYVGLLLKKKARFDGSETLRTKIQGNESSSRAPLSTGKFHLDVFKVECSQKHSEVATLVQLILARKTTVLKLDV